MEEGNGQFTQGDVRRRPGPKIPHEGAGAGDLLRSVKTMSDSSVGCGVRLRRMSGRLVCLILSHK